MQRQNTFAPNNYLFLENLTGQRLSGMLMIFQEKGATLWSQSNIEPELFQNT